MVAAELLGLPLPVGRRWCATCGSGGRVTGCDWEVCGCGECRKLVCPGCAGLGHVPVLVSDPEFPF